MKVLMINVVCGIRSTGRICGDLAKTLESQGNVVRIAYGREKVPAEFQKFAVKIGSSIDINIHGIRSRLFDECGWGSLKATQKFVEWIKEFNPDVIHIHNIHGYYINIAVLFEYLRACGKRIVWTLHDCWAFTGHSAYCDYVDCMKWTEGCYACPLMNMYPSSLIDRSKKNWLKKKELMSNIPNLTIVTPSEWLAGLVRKSFLGKYPLNVIHNGIDTSKFHPVESNVKTRMGINDKKMILGVATSWDEMKGFSDYLKLADMLDNRFQIVLAGLTQKQIKRLPENIIGITRTNDVRELVELYNAAFIFLNLSYCENYPTVNLEAVACETPIITYNVGGSPESAGKNAIVVERGNLKAVATAIMNNTGQRVVTNKIDIDYKTSLEKYLELYKKEQSGENK